jgi:acetolactate synthase-1/3 small subunit
MDQFIVSLLVNNHFGVLTRVAALFARRGFNIDSLTVGVTETPEFSRMTILAKGDDYIKEQIVKQLQKLEDVKLVQLMRPDQTVQRELLIVKVRVEKSKLSEITEAANTYRASVIDLSPDSLLIEITGEPQKINAFLEYIKDYGIIEMSRTGPTAMGRSNYCLANG